MQLWLVTERNNYRLLGCFTCSVNNLTILISMERPSRCVSSTTTTLSYPLSTVNILLQMYLF